MIFTRLLFLFIVVPLVELALLVKIGEIIGFWPTIGLVVVTGIIGASLAKAQGLRVFIKIRNELNAGRLPAAELLDGLLILVGGLVLLTPGLLTDLCGFALMVPAVRALLRKYLQKKFAGMVQGSQTGFYYRGGFGKAPPKFRDDFDIEE